jgi:anti-sigma28 factor (negative regulator of flagellin synthesis)
MITRSSGVANYFNAQGVGQKRDSSNNSSSSVEKSNETREVSKVERLKELIANGEYQVNLEATAKKMAQELM